MIFYNILILHYYFIVNILGKNIFEIKSYYLNFQNHIKVFKLRKFYFEFYTIKKMIKIFLNSFTELC